MDGLIAYILAKKIALGAVSGISNISINGNQIIFHLKDGTSATMTVPTPEDGKDGVDGIDGKDGKDGISVDSIKIDENNNLIGIMSNGTIINAGKIESSSIIVLNTTDELPDKGKIDTLYIVDSSIYIWTGSEYKQLSSGGGVIGNLQWGSF